jgi:hypothetical protein
MHSVDHLFRPVRRGKRLFGSAVKEVSGAQRIAAAGCDFFLHTVFQDLYFADGIGVRIRNPKISASVSVQPLACVKWIEQNRADPSHTIFISEFKIYGLSVRNVDQLQTAFHIFGKNSAENYAARMRTYKRA